MSTGEARAWPFEEARKLVKRRAQILGLDRGPLGPVLSREVASAEYTTKLPGAPDGEYVVIQYRTKFQNKADAIETVTPMRDQDGIFRVSGYYIR